VDSDLRRPEDVEVTVVDVEFVLAVVVEGATCEFWVRTFDWG